MSGCVRCSGPARPGTLCDPCRPIAAREKARRWRERHPEAVRAQRKRAYTRERAQPDKVARKRAQANAYRKANLVSFQNYGRRFRHGIEPEEFEALWRIQDGRCALCDAPLPESLAERRARREPQVDHDHVTGAVRGLLCRTCNTRLGVIEKVTPEWMRRVDLYRHRVPALSVEAARLMQEALG